MTGFIEDATDEIAAGSAETLSDEDVVSRVLEGDLALFEVIMRRYNQRLFRIVRGILADDADTEDVLQETYVRAFQHLAQFRGRARFSTWLAKIAVHEALARRRRQQRSRTVDFHAPENSPMVPLSTGLDPEQAASSEELATLLTEAVDALPHDLRVVVVMRLIEGLDTTEAADCLDLSESNVKVRLHRARALLREQIDARVGIEARKLYLFGGDRCDRVVRAVMARLQSD